MVDERRFHRNVLLFGKEGQRKIERTRVAIVGLGGVGSHIAQQLAYLGVREYTLIDRDVVTPSSMNRLIGAVDEDVRRGIPKVEVVAGHILRIRRDAHVTPVRDTFVSDAGFAAVKDADYVFGCVDKDGVRLILTEFCAAYARPYFDIATDVLAHEPQLMFGGRIVLSRGNRCPICTEVLDQNEIRRDLSSPDQREQDDRLYGIPRDALGDQGPSVVSWNGILASLCVTEFMVAVTGLREPKEHLTYYGMGTRDGRVTSTDTPVYPGCYYCKEVRGKGDGADVQHYIREGVGSYL